MVEENFRFCFKVEELLMEKKGEEEEDLGLGWVGFSGLDLDRILGRIVMA